MGTSLDATGAHSSLTQRRQAASNLPAFELPPPNLQFAAPQFTHKFPPLTGLGSAQHVQGNVNAGNLLTPPPNSSESSGASTANLPPGQAMPVLPYTPTFWQGQGATPNGFTTGLTPQPWQNSQMFGSRSMFSPMSGSITRTDPQSPSSSGASTLPPPPYELNGVHQYAQSVSLASPGPATNQNGQHPGLGNSMMSSHLRPPLQTSPISPADAVSKASSAPSLFTAMSASAAPQPPYGFPSSTSVSQSPHTATASTTSPPLQNGPIPHLQTQSNPFIKPPYPSYSLPAMPGPVLTNVGSPGSQMTVVGNMQTQMLPMHFNSGYAANPQLAYAQARANSPQQAANQDRPFKCDECPQSFNRNHDLKRHKRIHLAVKPFPCSHCEKSFSRKDALKVRFLSSVREDQANEINRDIFWLKAVAKLPNQSLKAVTASSPTRAATRKTTRP